MKKRVVSFSCIAVLIFAVMLYFSLPVMAESKPNDFSFDISEGDITVEKSENPSLIRVRYGNPQKTVDFANTQEITITGTSAANKIVVNNVSTKITLDGVDVQNTADDFCAFELNDNANVTLTLAENTTNILKSGTNKAGLQVPRWTSLTILGDGSLTATGGNYGAGIGGGYEGAGGTITISDGTVTATGINGAGIGGGASVEGTGGSGGTITINEAAAVIAVSSNVNRPSIHTSSGSLEAGSTANMLMANFAGQQAKDVTTAVYTKTSSLPCISFAPGIQYQSIAFTVPTDMYRLKTADKYQQHGSGADISADFSIPKAGLKTFSDVKDAAVYNITYVLNSGTNHQDNPATYTCGIGLTLQAPTQEGYSFAGWYDSQDFSGYAVTEITGNGYRRQDLLC